MGTLDEIRRLTAAIKVHLPTDRRELMIRARTEGKTWQEIADAAGMTQMGARKVVEGDGPRNSVAKELLGKRDPK